MIGTGLTTDLVQRPVTMVMSAENLAIVLLGFAVDTTLEQLVHSDSSAHHAFHLSLQVSVAAVCMAFPHSQGHSSQPK